MANNNQQQASADQAQIQKKLEEMQKELEAANARAVAAEKAEAEATAKLAEMETAAAEATAKLAEMETAAAEAENNQVNETVPARVKVFVPRGASNDDPNLFVAINGVNYLLPKGKESEVPYAVAKELELSKKAVAIRDKNMDALLDK